MSGDKTVKDEGTDTTSGVGDAYDYNTIYLNLTMPEQMRMGVYERIPGLRVKRNKAGDAIAVECANYNAFGEYMVKRFKFRKCAGAISGWEGDRRIVGDDEIKRLVCKVGYDVFDTDRARDSALRAIEMYAPEIDIEEASHYIGFKNGVYDVRDGSWSDGADSKPTMYCVPHELDVNHKCPDDSIVRRFLWTLACERDDVFEMMCEVIGFCMMSSLATREIPLLVSPGQHGKSTFLELIMNIIGEDMTCNKSVHELCDRFGLNDLRSCAVNIADDEDVSVFDPGQVRRIKIIGSHGHLFADRKGISGVDFRVVQRLIIASNSVPRTTARDANNGLWDRLVVVPFDADFSDHGRVKRVPNMRALLSTDEAIADAIALGIEAIANIRDNEWRLTKSGESLARNFEMRKASSNVLAWLDDEGSSYMGYDVDVNPLALAGVCVNDAYEMYARYCHRGGVKPFGRSSFSHEVCGLCSGLTSERVYMKRSDREGTTRVSIFWYTGDKTLPDEVMKVDFDTNGDRDSEAIGLRRVNRKSGATVV